MLNLFLVGLLLIQNVLVLKYTIDSGLIYFAQNASYLPPISGTTPDSVTSAVGFNENATLPFVPGKTYRLRVINTSAFSAFFFWIEGHQMTIIEADGVSTSCHWLTSAGC